MLKKSSTILSTATNSYDTASRLQAVTDGTHSVDYAYHANSQLVRSITSKRIGSTRLIVTNDFDFVNRLRSISSEFASSAKYGYKHDNVNQRTNLTLADGSYWVYGYDIRGQVQKTPTDAFLTVVAGARGSASKVIELGAGQKYRMYDINSQISFSAYNDALQWIGGGFREAMYARCSAKELGPCKETHHQVNGGGMLKKAMFGVLVLLSCGFAWYRWSYPHGHRPCRLACVASALVLYARDHDGWFPKDRQTPLEALALICPSYTSYHHLAGISGDTKEAVRRMSKGGIIDEKVSSWIYWPGLRNDDDPRIALIWERTPGIGPNGKRMGDRGGHSVGYVDGTFGYVRSADWNTFLKEQETLREGAFAGHK